MRNWESSGRVKIKRANEHIRYLKAEIDAFRNRRPYRALPEEDPDAYLGTAAVVRTQEKAPLLEWGAAAADAIHNLNVALDYLWQRSIHESGHASRDYFPVFADPESAKARFEGKETGRVKTAVDILFSIKAFEVGNAFWVIRSFDNADKHDTMVVAALVIDKIVLDMAKASGNPNAVFTREFSRDGWLFIEDGTKLFSFPERQMYVEPDFSFEIAFGDGEVLKGQPVVETLEDLSTTVESVAAAFAEKGLLS